MTNKQRYKQVFSTLHASDCIMEVKAMKRKTYIPRLAAACAAVVMVMSAATVAYAADIGGIQRIVQIWIKGDQTDAVLETSGNGYTVTYDGQDGESHSFGGGGVAFNDDGTERPLTDEEILEHLNSPDVEYREDGAVWVRYRGEELDITDRFDESGVCYVKLTGDDGSLYMTVKYQGGHATSPHSYIAPEDFNTGED